MKKIIYICFFLMCLAFSAAAEDMTGWWGFSGGAEVHGDGFVLYADGNGEVLEALNYAYYPLSRFCRTGSTFT